MRRLKAIRVILVPLMILSGCSGYQLSGREKSVIVDSISPRTITVTFCGNAYMSQKEVEKYTLQRASEAALSKGFSHFVVLEKRDDSEMCMLGSKGPYGQEAAGQTGVPLSSYASDFKRPNVTLTIKCFKKGEEVPADAVNAEEFLRENFPGVI